MLSTKCTPNNTRLFRFKGIFFLGFLISTTLLLGYFHFDKALKLYLQKNLSEAYGFSVDIGTVHTKLLDQSVELHRVQFSNPEISMKNLLEFDTVQFHFQLADCFRKKLIIPELKIVGIHYDTVRDESGKPVGSNGFISSVVSSADKTGFNIHSVIRKQMDQDPLKYLAPISLGFRMPGKTDKSGNHLKTLDHIKEAQLKLDLIKESWQAFSNSLQADEKSLMTKGPHSQIRNRLEVQIKKAQLESQAIETWLETLDEPLKIDVSSMRKTLDLPRFERWDLTATLFGPLTLNSMERINYWSTLTRDKIRVPKSTASVQVIASPRQAGLSFHFGSSSSKPTFLIEKINLESETDPARSSQGTVRGEIKHLSFDSGLMGLPIEVQVQADFPGKNLRHLHLNASIIHQKNKLSESFNLTIEELPLNKWILYRSADFRLMMAPTIASLNSKGLLTDNAVDIEWNLGITEPKISIASRYIQVEDLLKDLLQGIGPFVVKTEVTGPLTELHYRTESALGTQLADGLKLAYERTVSGVDDDLKNRLVEQTALPRRAVLDSLLEAETKHLASWQIALEKLDIQRTETERNAAQQTSHKRAKTKN